MPRPRPFKRCGVCGQAIIQSGRARQWVHVDQFHQKLDHTPAPGTKTALGRPGTGAPSSPPRTAAGTSGPASSPGDPQAKLLGMIERKRPGS